jgi:xylulokinase
VYLGIDIGTSAVKAVLLDETGAVIEQSSAPLPIYRPRPLWSEQSPADWWAGTQQAVSTLSGRGRLAVKAIGMTGQMHGATVLDSADQPLRPAILWNDGRSHREAAELQTSEPGLPAITGNLAMPGFTAPKLLWLRRHEPDLFSKVRSVLLPKDYVRLRMTGEKVTDMSDAAGTLWLDVERRCWSEELLSATDLSIAHMPRLAEGPQPSGLLRREVAEQWGMQQVPVAAGGGDNAAGAAGVGVIAEGQALLSLGTSGVVFVANEAFRPNPATAVHTFCHCLPDRWHQMSVHLSAASCLDWAARLTGVKGPAELIARAEERGALGRAELFLPYLSGERTPHNDPHARGALLGLTHDSDAAAIGQAVLEGVAFALAEGLAAITATGTQVTELTVVGGGARSRYWGRLISAALDKPLVYRSGSDIGPALGAACLARILSSGWSPERICTPPRADFRIEPARADVRALADSQQRFRAAYGCLKPLFTLR